MKQKTSITWFSFAGIIGILFGIFYSFFGLEGFPAYNALISENIFNNWSDGLYGSVFIGFSMLLLFVGRQAFKNNDKPLMQALLYGVSSWLIVEALFSLYYGVYFNVVVDIALMAFLGFPLMWGIKSNDTKT